MKLKTQIALGYTCALSIAIFGTLAGFAFGNYAQNQALEKLENAANERQFLTQLQVNILYNRPAKQLGSYIYNSEEFTNASNAFFKRIKSIEKDIIDYNSNPDSQLQGLDVLLEDYQKVVALFIQKAEVTLPQIQALSRSPQTLEEAELLLLDFAKSEEFVQFIEFPDRLEKYSDRAMTYEAQAEESLSQAELLRDRITLMSLGLSVAVAAIFAFLNSRAIARPLQTTTQIAQQVTQNDNFDLQAPITSNNEIAVLTEALNQLIQRVKQLLIEQKIAEAKLVQSEKMSSLGQLVAGIAHEINNPISFIHGNVIHADEYSQNLIQLIQAYQKDYPHPSEKIQTLTEEVDLSFTIKDLKKIFKSMRLGTERIKGIVESLRNFVRLDESDIKTVDIHEGLDNSLIILKSRLLGKADQPKIQVIKNYGHLPKIECYPSQLNQVFMNILINAIDVLERNPQKLGKITITTEVISPEQIAIRIADNGIGINEDIKNKIFDPFFTTKPIGQGTGLGLSISYQIITEIHQGTIECYSEPDQGTEFCITIPVVHSSEKSEVNGH